jgi:serine/threonine-protein kinase
MAELFGTYLLIKRIGRGAMGDVHLARPIRGVRGLPSTLVIKRILKEHARDERFILRFAHEAQVATRIMSPNVARIYDAGCVGGTLYIAFEYVAGWPLSQVIEDLKSSHRVASLESVADVIDGALEGLHALHTAADERGIPLGIVHRDIAPKNVMLGTDGRVRLIDLGVTKSRLSEWRTSTGALVGTPGYMAPEQVAAKPVDHRTDIYAMGVVLFELLTLQLLMDCKDLSEVLRRSLLSQYRPPSSVRRDVPPELDSIAARALAFEPRDRYTSAREMQAELRALFPRRRTTAAGTLIGAILQEERTRTESEMLQLSSALADYEDTVEQVPTQVVTYARAPGVDMQRTVASDPRPAGRGPISAARVSALRPRWTHRARRLALYLVLLGGGVLIGRSVGREAPVELPQSEHRPVAVELAHSEVPPALDPIARVVPRAESRPEAPIAPPSARTMRHPALPPRPKPVVEEEIKSPLPEQQESSSGKLKSLLDRAIALRDAASDQRRKPITDYIVKLNRFAVYGTDLRRDEIADLERELSVLASSL